MRAVCADIRACVCAVCGARAKSPAVDGRCGRSRTPVPLSGPRGEPWRGCDGAVRARAGTRGGLLGASRSGWCREGWCWVEKARV